MRLKKRAAKHAQRSQTRHGDQENYLVEQKMLDSSNKLVVELNEKLKIAQEEIKQAGSYDHTVVNQNLDQTVVEIEGFIEAAQKKRSKEKDVIRAT